VRLDPLDKDSLADFEYFTLTAQDGQSVPLSAFVPDKAAL